MEREVIVTALSALAQDTRLDIFRLLVEAGAAGLAAGSIGEALNTPAPTLSFHLQQLRHAGLVAPRKKGTQLIYTANYAAMNAVIAYLTENCCQGDSAGCAPATGCMGAPQCQPLRQES